MNVDLNHAELRAIINALEARALTFKLKLLEVGRETHEPMRMLRRYVGDDEALAKKLAAILRSPPT